MTPLINWIDAKYLKEELPKTQGHFVQIVREKDIVNTLILLFEIIREPIPENANLQRPIIIDERERIVNAIETSFKRIVVEDIGKLKR